MRATLLTILKRLMEHWEWLVLKNRRKSRITLSMGILIPPSMKAIMGMATTLVGLSSVVLSYLTVLYGDLG